jgi:hypothetical protein
MNKKGDITTTIFVIGVVALCFFAMISFYISNLNSSDNFIRIQSIQNVNTKIERGDNSDGNFNGKNYYRETSSSLGIWPFDIKKIYFEVTYFLD